MQNLPVISKMTERSCGFEGKPFKTIVIQVYAPTNNAKEAEFEDLQYLLELTPKKDILFIVGDWDAKVRKSRDTWNNRQFWPWNTK